MLSSEARDDVRGAKRLAGKDRSGPVDIRTLDRFEIDVDDNAIQNAYGGEFGQACNRVGTLACRDPSFYNLRARTHQSHQMTKAGPAMVAMEVLMFWSNRVATRRQSLNRQNMRSKAGRWR